MNQCGAIAWHSFQMGQEWLCPPSVAGWDWGKGWISSDSSLKRMSFQGSYTWYEKKKDEWHPVAGLARIVNDLRPAAKKPVGEFVATFLDYYDAGHISETARGPISTLFEKHGFQGDQDDRGFGWMLQEALKLLMASPEYHLH
jgi:hypothetical protein